LAVEAISSLPLFKHNQTHPLPNLVRAVFSNCSLKASKLPKSFSRILINVGEGKFVSDVGFGFKHCQKKE
jgi:hypothetical protein